MSPQTIEAIGILPPEVQRQLNEITALFAASDAVQILLLFGSYARGDFVIDLNTGYRSDYDLLVVTQSVQEATNYKLFSGIEEQAKQIAGKTPVSLIRHDIAELNREIRMGQFFFADIIREGIVLYDSHHVQLAKPKAATIKERFDLTKGYFKTWFASATSLWNVSHHIPFAERRMAAFLLHQAAERYFHAVTLVYDGYKHRTHNLELLAAYAEPHHQLLQPSLARSVDEDKHYFDLLKRAYIEARYSLKYDIDQTELIQMRSRVCNFAKRVRLVCLEKLASYFGVDAIGELPNIDEEVDLNELPPPPDDIQDKEALELWQQVVRRFVHKRGEQRYTEGKQEGRAEGRAEGLQEGEALGEARARAHAIIDVLKRRDIALSDEDTARILACGDTDLLAQYWERAFLVSNVEELFGE
ncbi:MAG: HEPN domain-containing protein [Deltaproteobacteria bacterium]|nr:HEPN domain-containing protein [Deltaproteobacteria bacterium]